MARTRFVGALPEHGPWTAVGLTRRQFGAILAVSIALFVFVGGPVWRHVHEGHLPRVAVSYAVIPAAVAVVLHRTGELRPARLVAASAVLALVKLVITAALLVALALGR